MFGTVVSLGWLVVYGLLQFCLWVVDVGLVWLVYCCYVGFAGLVLVCWGWCITGLCVVSVIWLG